MNILIIGASGGIGLALAQQRLETLPQTGRLILTARAPGGHRALQDLAADKRVLLYPLDVSVPASIDRFGHFLAEEVPELDLSIYTPGLLHDGAMQPEKRFEQLDAEALSRSFAVNASGPVLVAQTVIPRMRHKRRAVIANLSARVGSIADNRSGGWYAYRASKAAQNMLTKTLSIELKRRASNIICVALHPGTVDTELSKPFQVAVPPEKLFSSERAARQILEIIDSLAHDETGSFFDWKREPIEW